MCRCVAWVQAPSPRRCLSPSVSLCLSVRLPRSYSSVSACLSLSITHSLTLPATAPPSPQGRALVLASMDQLRAAVEGVTVAFVATRGELTVRSSLAQRVAAAAPIVSGESVTQVGVARVRAGKERGGGACGRVAQRMAAAAPIVCLERVWRRCVAASICWLLVDRAGWIWGGVHWGPALASLANTRAPTH
jgi:hypothetical protein